MTKKHYWLTGIILAVVGVALARLAGIITDELVPKIICWIAGSMMALGGLALIMIGMRAKR